MFRISKTGSRDKFWLIVVVDGKEAAIGSTYLRDRHDSHIGVFGINDTCDDGVGELIAKR